MTSIWVAAIIFAIIAVVLGALSFVPLFLQARAETVAYRLDIPLPESQYHTVRTRLARRYRGIAIGGLLGATIAVVTIPAPPAGSDGFDAVLLVIGLVFTGMALGVSVASAWRPVARDPGAVTMARVEAVRLSDYIAPIELQGARVVVGASVVLVIVALARGMGPSTALAAVLSGLSIASLVFFEVFGRRVVARPQPASTPEELKWDDALRSAVLRDIVTAPLGLGAYSVLLVILGFIGTADLGSAGLIGLALAIIAAAISATRPQRYFLRRLWHGARA